MSTHSHSTGNNSNEKKKTVGGEKKTHCDEEYQFSEIHIYIYIYITFWTKTNATIILLPINFF